jgi:hypothetical protein
MAYPTFNIGSIQRRCNDDITKFKTENLCIDDTRLNLETNKLKLNTYEKLLFAIKLMVNYIDSKLNPNPNALNSRTYVEAISYQPSKQQEQLWIARTYLFYQLLIFLTLILDDAELYNNVFNIVEQQKNPFRQDIKNNLQYFKMGIFGSRTPTSDIDLGIQYSGNALKTPGLAYIVSIFESLFVIFTHKPRGSLAYDIETYADMVTLPNPDKTDTEHPDYFYLDSSNFTEAEFNRMLVCAGKSIARNILLANKEVNNPNVSDTTKYEEVASKIEMALQIYINNKVEQCNTNGLSIEECTSAAMQSVTNADIISKLILQNNANWLADGMTYMKNFIKLTYNEQRTLYYAAVNKAEQIKFDKTKGASLEGLGKLTPSDICDMMVSIGDALAYRMESYTCSPTVIHVVRILQASKDNPNKYATVTPGQYCNGEIVRLHLDPFCSIGNYGYVLSALEQMGYIYRFWLTYCDNNSNGHYDDAKCSKKLKKYFERYIDACDVIKKYNPSIQSETSNGGRKKVKRSTRKRSTRKRTKRTRRTKRR